MNMRLGAGELRNVLISALCLCMAAVLAGCGQADQPPAGQVVEADVPSDVAPDAAAQEADPLTDYLAALTADVTRLEDANAIRTLQRTYGYYVDQGAWDDVADLFADDASMEIGLRGVYIGRERIRKFLYAVYGVSGLREGQLNENMQLQGVVHVDPDGEHAKARWRSYMFAGMYGKSATLAEGPYENEYVKEKGVWKISRLHWFETFTVPYEGGWAHNENVNRRSGEDIGWVPDLPPSVDYERWPAVSIPPFHYAHPSTDPKVEPAVIPSDIDEPVLSDTLWALRNRVARLQDKEQIENILGAYGYYMDKCMADEVAGLFADNGTMEFSQRGVYIGRDHINKAMALFCPHGLQQGHLQNQLLVQPVIHVSEDGTRAFARLRSMAMMGTYDAVGIWGDAIYEMELVKTDGRWQILHDHSYATFYSLYNEGFARGVRPAPGISSTLPPDAPPTEVYQALPGVYLPAFHYPHPVTGKPIYGGLPKIALSAAPKPVPADITGHDDIAALAERVTLLEDHKAVEDLQRTYGFMVDKALWGEVSELFTDDGTLEIGGRGIFVGQQRIHEYLLFLGKEGPLHGRLINHIQLQPVVHVSADGKTAKARMRFVAQGGDATDPENPPKDAPGVPTNGYLGMGTYENEYVKDNGVWKIKTLHAYFRMYTVDNQGWGKVALPITTVEPLLPPDRPPSMAYTQYPDIFIPPLHYPNPVSAASTAQD
ncbi:MAG: nuclear transport factor 2 family protein [Gammaproteobacteria bacterium]|nr:nuclear transport factor 2 family protein [Gammaproteobacteria bacterium]